MKTRVISGAVAAVALVALIVLGAPSVILSVVLFCSVLAVLEYERLFFDRPSVSRQLRLAVLVILLVISIRHGADAALATLWLGLVAQCLWYVLTVNNDGISFPEAARSLSLEFFGWVYIASLFGFLLPILELPGGRHYVLLLFLVVSVGDTAAYFVGSRFGKRLLASRISPKKTVEGALGAVLVSVGVALGWLYFVARETPDPRRITEVLLLALVGSLLAQAGDLFESVLKRSQGKKDSGNFLPGHGGILDRVDGLALVAPTFYLYLRYTAEVIP